jgi:hypothetical protein
MITKKLSALSSLSTWGTHAFIAELHNYTYNNLSSSGVKSVGTTVFCVYATELNEKKTEWEKKEKVFEFVTTLPCCEDTLQELRKLYFSTLK